VCVTNEVYRKKVRRPYKNQYTIVVPGFELVITVFEFWYVVRSYFTYHTRRKYHGYSNTVFECWYCRTFPTPQTESKIMHVGKRVGTVFNIGARVVRADVIVSQVDVRRRTVHPRLQENRGVVPVRASLSPGRSR